MTLSEHISKNMEEFEKKFRDLLLVAVLASGEIGKIDIILNILLKDMQSFLRDSQIALLKEVVKEIEKRKTNTSIFGA